MATPFLRPIAALGTLSLVAAAILLMPRTASAQATTSSHSSFDFNTDGISFATADSSSKVMMRFRMQNTATVTTKSVDDLSFASTDWAVRRLRIRFGGHLVDPRLTFNLQLSFARGDLDYTDTQFPNIVRDAMIFWNFSPRLQVSFGQTKLPGNRQRVISSADIQFPDRSIVNSAFTLDRDFGFQGFWRPVDGDVIVNLRGAISSGDGRNQPAIPGGGLAYTGRAEILPFGAFLKGGDYFEGDLLREPSPKVSVGLSFQHNENQTRTKGSLGAKLYEQRTAQTIYADALLKYSGLAIYCEYARRSADDPLTHSSDNKVSAVFVGHGMLAQVTYCFPFMFEVGTRFARVVPDDVLKTVPEGFTDQTTSLNFGYYLNKHRVKMQIELGRGDREVLATDVKSAFYFGRFNMELGI